MASVVTVDGLFFQRTDREGNAQPILKNVNMEIGDREFVSVVGPSGCGKTTLLGLCTGLLQPSQGQVLIGGAKALPSNIDKAVVFQQDSLFPWRTIQDNIALGLERGTASRKARHDKAAELATLVGLEGYEKHYPHELSGGMRQRVNVARALAVDPKVLLMDEPFSALDAQTRDLMQLELLRIWAVGKKTVMFVTHQIDEAVFLSDRVIVLSKGPGQVLADIKIDLPRPRTLDAKLSPKFQEYMREIWALIEPMHDKKVDDDTKESEQS